MASVFNQVKIYLGQSLVSELSLKGFVKHQKSRMIKFDFRTGIGVITNIGLVAQGWVMKRGYTLFDHFPI